MRGHNSWLFLPIIIIRSSLVIYKLTLEDALVGVEWMSYWVFVSLYAIIYVFLCMSVGVIDIKKGTYKGQAEIDLWNNPVWKEHFSKLNIIENQVNMIHQTLSLIIQKIQPDFTLPKLPK